jgi:hypothetical protein
MSPPVADDKVDVKGVMMVITTAVFTHRKIATELIENHVSTAEDFNHVYDANHVPFR